MRADLALLTVSRVIIHEVPHRRDNTAPVLSEIESPMDADIGQLIKERIIATVGDPTKSFEIELAPETTSPVPGLIAAHLATPPPDILVENSQAMAQHLFTTQPTTSPGGLLLVILATVAAGPAVVILKLEKEEGARIVPHPAAGGKRTFNIKHYKDLILTPKTKVFKIALFTSLDDGIEALACDNQRPYAAHKALADYFLHQFLGCRMAASANVNTREFFDRSNDFFRQHYGKDPKRYASVYLQLVSDLQSNKTTISPRRFAADHLPVKDQKAFISYLEQHGIKQTSFDKDTEFLDKELTRIMYGFASGTKLILPSEEAEQRVKLTNQTNGEVTVEFTDRLTDMKGKIAGGPMDDLQAARQRWQNEQPRYQAFLDDAAASLERLLRQNGIYGQISRRTKAPDSLLKKLLRKPHHTYETLADKAAMRVVVRFASELAGVRSIIEGYFFIIKIDDKAANLAPDQFRYQGVHYDARLPAESQFADLQLEIQLCTRAQNLWSDLSHDLAYKSVIDLPAAIHRQVHSLSALLEVVDREFDLIIQAIRALPNAQALHILTALERSFFRINPASYAKDLSIDVITSLAPLYPSGTDLAGAHFEAFSGHHAAKLEHVLLRNTGRSPFLSQPEVVMIFDLLEFDEFRLQELWNAHFPASELEQLAVLWGKPLP